MSLYLSHVNVEAYSVKYLRAEFHHEAHEEHEGKTDICLLAISLPLPPRERAGVRGGIVTTPYQALQLYHLRNNPAISL